MAAPGASQGRRMLVRAKASTDPAHGTRPEDRSMEAYLRRGVVNLDKPAGPTSHQAVAWLKQALDLPKAGHGGTLDPNVTGVLPVALLDATRVVKTLLEAPKEYVCVLETHKDAPEAEIRQALKEFQGPIYQMPPLKSAVKRELRVRTIYELDVLEVRGRHALFRVSCEAGTYIRKLCTDAGLLLSTGASMRDLRRTRTGPFTEASSVSLHDLKDAYLFWKESGDEAPLREVVRPVEALVAHLSRIVVRDSAVDAIAHGADLAVPGVVEAEETVQPGRLSAVFTLKGELVATATPKMSALEMVAAKSGVAAKTTRVVMDPGVYPRAWTRSAEAV